MSGDPIGTERRRAMGRAALEAALAFVIAGTPLLFVAMVIGGCGGPTAFLIAASAAATVAGIFAFRCGRWEWVRAISSDMPCLQCGYDLRDTKRGTCPECGTRFRRV